MLKGFKEFIMRGNAVDLAVGVVIGAAFSGVVNSLVTDFLTPLISAVAKLPDFSRLVIHLNGSELRYGNLLNSLISFVLVAIAIYFFVIIPMQKVFSRFTHAQTPISKVCQECCSEIPYEARRCKHCGQLIAA